MQALAKIDSGSSASVHPSGTTLLQSHPATSERIARLASISQTVLEPRDFLWWISTGQAICLGQIGDMDGSKIDFGSKPRRSQDSLLTRLNYRTTQFLPL